MYNFTAENYESASPDTERALGYIISLCSDRSVCLETSKMADCFLIFCYSSYESWTTNISQHSLPIGSIPKNRLLLQIIV